MKPFRLFQGSLIRRLALLFLILGFIPATLFTIVPTTIQSRSSQKAADEVRLALERQAEEGLSQLADTNALRYSLVFEAKAEIAKMLANFITDIMGASSPKGGLTNDYFGDLLEKNDEGWLLFGADSLIGFMGSPLMQQTDEVFERQNTLSRSTQLLKSTVDANPLIRSVFIITEDQTIWMYPNLFWMEGAFHQPRAVYIDPYFLTTLPKREFGAGVAEIIKMAVTFNKDFFEFLEKRGSKQFRDFTKGN